MASIKKYIVFCYVLYYKIASLELNGSICSNIDTDIFYDNVISAKEYQKTPRGNNMSHFLWEIEKKKSVYPITIYQKIKYFQFL